VATARLAVGGGVRARLTGSATHRNLLARPLPDESWELDLIYALGQAGSDGGDCRVAVELERAGVVLGRRLPGARPCWVTRRTGHEHPSDRCVRKTESARLADTESRHFMQLFSTRVNVRRGIERRKRPLL
jgi:hypothetical protein